MPKPAPHASPAKSQQGQWKLKPTALVSAVGTSKQAIAKAGADALALMPQIPTASATAPTEAAVGPASIVKGHNAPAAAAASNNEGRPQGMCTLTLLDSLAGKTVYSLSVCVGIHTAQLDLVHWWGGLAGVASASAAHHRIADAPMCSALVAKPLLHTLVLVLSLLQSLSGFGMLYRMSDKYQ